LFLDSCGSAEKAAEVCKNYYELRQSSPEFFSNRDPSTAENQHSLRCERLCMLPVTPSNDLVIFFRPATKLSDYKFDSSIKIAFMVMDSCLQHHGPRDGAIFLFDMKGTGILHITKASIRSIRKYLCYLQEAIPLKLRAIHVFNTAYFMDRVLALIKPFMRSELLNHVST